MNDHEHPEYLQVRNWDRFQNADVFKKSGGRPPWIKLHQQILDDPELSQLTFAELGQLVKLWLLAARLGNRIPDNKTWWRKHFGAHSASIRARFEHRRVIIRATNEQQTSTEPPANHNKPSRTSRDSIASLSRQDLEEDKEDLDLGVNLKDNGARTNANGSGKLPRLKTYVETVAWQYEPPSLLEDLLAKGATPDEAEELLTLATAIAQRKQGENARAS